MAAEEHAQLYGEERFCRTKNESAVRGTCTLRSAHGSCDEALVKDLETTIIHAGALTRHRHAAGYARFEHAKYAHLHRGRFPSVVRGAALQSRAYIGSAAKRRGASVDVGEMTACRRLGRAGRRVNRAARRALNSVHAQRMRGTRIDVAGCTRALDAAFAGLKTQYPVGRADRAV